MSDASVDQGKLYEEFSTESGLFSDYEGLITGTWVMVDEYGRTNVHFEIQILDRLGERENDMTEEKYSVGNKWKSADGNSLEHVEGNLRAKINSNSQYGRLIQQATSIGAVPEMAKAAEARGMVFTAKNPQVWIGTKWHFAEFTNEYTDQTTKEKRTSVKNLPDKFLGIGEIIENQAWEKMVDSEQRATLAKLAAAAPDLDTFVSSAIENGWVTTNGQLLAAITDGTVYNTLRS